MTYEESYRKCERLEELKREIDIRAQEKLLRDATAIDVALKVAEDNKQIIECTICREYYNADDCDYKQIVAEVRAENTRLQESNNLYQKENKELLRAITLHNRQFKRLTEKYEKLKKGKQVETLQELVLKREKELRRLRGKK